MINLHQVAALYRPSLYKAAGQFSDRHGCVPPDWELEVVHREACGEGLLLTATIYSQKRSTFIPASDIEAAMDAGLEWRYRLIAGPRVWRRRPLWMRRDFSAMVELLKHHRDKVFTTEEAVS